MVIPKLYEQMTVQLHASILNNTIRIYDMGVISIYEFVLRSLANICKTLDKWLSSQPY